MRERRLPWVLTSVLLLASAGAAAWSTYLHWAPCRGSLLDYSIVRGYQQGPGPGFSDECLRWMDSGSLPFPYPLELATTWEHAEASAPWAVAAMVLAGVAWLVLALGSRWSARTTVVALLPGLALLALAAASIATTTAPGTSGAVSGWLGVAPYAAAALALTAVWHWQPETQGRSFTRLVVVAWGVTAFGTVNAIVDWMVMVAFLSEANWDTPPLTGSVTVLTVTASAILTFALAQRSPRPPGQGTEALVRKSRTRSRPGSWAALR